MVGDRNTFLMVISALCALAFFHCFLENGIISDSISRSLRSSNHPRITADDYIMQEGWDSSPIVLPKYKLVLFTVPKAGCTVVKQLARRMTGVKKWYEDNNKSIPHDPAINGLTYLRDYSLKEATEIMTSEEWTRAIFLRDPHERILSAYMDKCVKTNHMKLHYPREPKDFEDFVEHFVPEYRDQHWLPQRTFVDDKWWPYVNFIGFLSTASNDMEVLLRRVGAWEKYGKSGWGCNGCEKGGSSVYQRNSAKHATGSKSLQEDYYTDGLWNAVKDHDNIYDSPICEREEEDESYIAKGLCVRHDDLQSFLNMIHHKDVVELKDDNKADVKDS